MAFCALFMTIIILGTKNYAAEDGVIDEYGSFTSNVSSTEPPFSRHFAHCLAELQENSLGDWWDYLFDESDESKGWFGKIFPKKWYNDDIYTNDEAAMIMNYNKLVGEQSSAAPPRAAPSDHGGERAAGGLLIVQVRGTDGPCITPLYQGFESAYDKLAP